jgi:hypothetical protein
MSGPIYRDTGDRERLRAVPRWFALWLLMQLRRARRDD